jgi:hypothetical protein
MNKVNKHIRLLAFLAALAIILSFSEPALAQDDGARAYWNAQAGTQMFSFQYFRMDIGASDSQAFDPGHYIYPNSDTEASVFLLSWGYHMTLFNRPSILAVTILGGHVGVDVNTNKIPPEYLPPGVRPGTSISQSSSGFADPSMQLVVNLLGTPPLRGGVDLLNYEPTFSLDLAMLIAFPIGEYESEKLVNLGLNRWYGRVALPFKYHFGVFDPGHMSSLEVIPSVWLFAENSDFMGQKLENDPLWSLEAHLTHDFTTHFFGSLDMLYQSGFHSKINGEDAGEKLEIGNLGFALNYQISDNVVIRTSFSSNVFGDKNLETSVLRIQFVYAWNPATERMKKLSKGH